jgi:hypothetical protein
MASNSVQATAERRFEHEWYGATPGGKQVFLQEVEERFNETR